jgi:amino acid transporter
MKLKYKIITILTIVISQILLFIVIETLIDPTVEKQVMGVIASYFLGAVTMIALMILQNSRPDNIKVYKITKRDGDIEEMEEITPR